MATVTSILMINDTFALKPGADGPDTVLMYAEGGSYNVGASYGEVPAHLAAVWLDRSDAAPETIDGKRIDSDMTEGSEYEQ